MARQLHFYRLSNDLRAQLDLPSLPTHRSEDDSGIEASVSERVASHLPLSIHDVTEAFTACESSMVQQSLSSGALMLGLPLPAMAGRLGVKTLDVDGAQLPRLGRELAGAAKLAGVKGIFHSDELPAYGIGQEDVEAVRTMLNLAAEDAFVLCCAPSWQAHLALEAVLARARLAWHRIPQEVRNVVIKKGAPEDGTTSPMRPLPGRSRMYPETDVPPHMIDDTHWDHICAHLPMSDDARAQRLNEYPISEDQASQILARELDDIFVGHASQVPAKAWASLLLAHDEINPAFLVQAISMKEDGTLSREHIETVIDAYRQGLVDVSSLADYCLEHELAPADVGGLAEIIEGIIAQRLDFVKERGMGAMGPLMGVVMQEAGGADGKEVSALLRAAIQSVME